MVNVNQNKVRKIGFIVEGASERIIIESIAFKSFLSKNDFELVSPVIDANGAGNLLPHNIQAYINRFKQQQVDAIYVLTDLENESSNDIVRQRVEHPDIAFIFIAVKALEAWYLADTSAIQTWLKLDSFYEDQPEQTPSKPWDRLKEIANENGRSGPGQKIGFAKKMTKHWNFSIENAALHPACPSAKELIQHFTVNL